MTSDDPPSALLTAKQRRFLQGEEEVSYPRNVRKRIRDRVETSVATDGELLNDEIDPTKIFDNVDPQETADGIRSLVAFLYEAADATAGVDAERLIKDGVAEGRGDRLTRIKTKFRMSPSKVTMGEIQLLAEHGYLSDEEHTELFKRGLAGGLDAEAIEEIVGGPRTPPEELQHTLDEIDDDSVGE